MPCATSARLLVLHPWVIRARGVCFFAGTGFVVGCDEDFSGDAVGFCVS